MAKMTVEVPDMQDMQSAADVEVLWAKHEDGFRLWVNVHGVCKLRIYRIGKLYINESDISILLAALKYE